MRTTKRLVAVALLALMLASQTACPKGEKLAGYAEDVVEALNLSLPLLEQAGVNVAKVKIAVGIGNQLVAALKAGQSDSAVDLTAKLISAFELIVTDVNTIPMSQSLRTKILVGLAAGQIALRIIARNLEESKPAGVLTVNSETAKIKTYAAKPKWRCRSSQTGRFAEMSFCKQHPDVSIVETY